MPYNDSLRFLSCNDSLYSLSCDNSLCSLSCNDFSIDDVDEGHFDCACPHPMSLVAFVARSARRTAYINQLITGDNQVRRRVGDGAVCDA